MNLATPLYSSFGRPCSTHRVAPPMIEFCGLAFTSGEYGIMPMPTLSLPSAFSIAEAEPDEAMWMAHSPPVISGVDLPSRPP